MADPRKSPPWGSAQFLKDADETAAEMLMKLLLECHGNTLLEQALKVPRG